MHPSYHYTVVGCLLIVIKTCTYCLFNEAFIPSLFEVFWWLLLWVCSKRDVNGFSHFILSCLEAPTSLTDDIVLSVIAQPYRVMFCLSRLIALETIRNVFYPPLNENTQALFFGKVKVYKTDRSCSPLVTIVTAIVARLWLKFETDTPWNIHQDTGELFLESRLLRRLTYQRLLIITGVFASLNEPHRFVQKSDSVYPEQNSWPKIKPRSHHGDFTVI